MFYQDSRACSRNTDGTMCSADTCGGWGVCGGFVGTCGNDGDQSRTCTTRVCSGGACGNGGSYGDSRGCSRNTDGTSCGADSCGLCSYGTQCTETGSRTCTPQVCGGGSCGAGTPFTDTSGCGRTTEYDLCGAPLCPGGENL